MQKSTTSTSPVCFNSTPGSIVAMDRAYIDCALFDRWIREGIFFVTRMKDNAVYTVIENRTPPKNSSITSGQIIRLDGNGAQKKCPHLLRRVVVRDEKHKRDIVLLTNHLEFGAATISSIYKDRWEIEIFFKALKQNLKIKSFVGTSENAMKIQIWTAVSDFIIRIEKKCAKSHRIYRVAGFAPWLWSFRPIYTLSK